MPQPTTYLTLKRAAHLLGMHKQTLRSWERQGQIRMGYWLRKWLLDRDFFPTVDERWVNSGLVRRTLDVLSHDDKIDLPVLAVRSPVRYIGALGSRQTMAKRAKRLRELGVNEEQLRRIHNSIGLDLGGRTPEEMALATMAEMVVVRNQARLPGRTTTHPDSSLLSVAP
ncbi:MAG: XdhC family protein [Caldilineales bacterium]|nr:XdhC family protein [Caldilineales bacterium]MCW5857994.1 XdhC family protein [Caldilineales bacterium]